MARHLGVGRSTLYRTFAAYDEAIATGREPGTPSSMVGPSEAPVQGA
ncbi:hypothetical protein [Streptomyces sp. NBC_00378]